MTKTAVKEKDETLFGVVEAPAKGKNPLQKPTPAKPEPQPKQRNAVAVRTTQAAPMNMLAVLANAAADPKCEPAKMRELYAIHKEMAADQAKIDFLRDFSALQAENLHINAKGKIVIPAKDGKAGQSTAYAKFNDITKAIKPLLQKHHFTLSFETEPSTDASRLIVKGRLAHDNGHERVTAFPLPAEVSGSKNNVQGWGSSMSYGKRYCTIALLNLTSEAMEDKDDDGIAAGKTTAETTTDVGKKTIDAEQVKKLSTAIDFCGVGAKKFCERYKIEKIDDLPSELFNEAMKACQDYVGKKAAAEKK